jgi:NAD(P)-dependent dehydrogenase (short-subunit alcohol dehydrogenase family)
MKQCTTYLKDNQHILQPLTNDKVIIITGANSGLGYYTALSLAERKAHVLLACRSLQKCDAAKNDILQTYANASVSTMALDLSSFQSIRTFVDNVKAVHSHVDVLINNAGIMAVNPREVTADGLEAQIGVNHFGHFLLTCLLFPLLAKNGRIVNHSSGAHNFHASTFPYFNLQSEDNYEPWTAYGNSKVANLLFTFELNRKLMRGRNSKGIISIAVHPGYTATNLQNGKYPFWDVANSWIGMKGEDGALSQIMGENCCTD